MSLKKDYFELLKNYYLCRFTLLIYVILFLSEQTIDIFFIFCIFGLLYLLINHLWTLFIGLKEIIHLKKEVHYGR